jgi:hypothetical protein
LAEAKKDAAPAAAPAAKPAEKKAEVKKVEIKGALDMSSTRFDVER